MNPLDILMLVIVLYCLIMGLLRGFVREITSIGGVIAGFYGACFFYSRLAGYLSKWIHDPTALDILGFLIIFTSVFIFVNIAGILLKYFLKIIDITWQDRGLGGIFGTIKGILIISVLLMGLTTFLKNNAPIIKASLFAPYIMSVSEMMSQTISEDMKKKYKEKVDRFKKAWEEKI